MIAMICQGRRTALWVRICISRQLARFPYARQGRAHDGCRQPMIVVSKNQFVYASTPSARTSMAHQSELDGTEMRHKVCTRSISAGGSIGCAARVPGGLRRGCLWRAFERSRILRDFKMLRELQRLHRASIIVSALSAAHTSESRQILDASPMLHLCDTLCSIESRGARQRPWARLVALKSSAGNGSVAPALGPLS